QRRALTLGYRGRDVLEGAEERAGRHVLDKLPVNLSRHACQWAPRLHPALLDAALQKAGDLVEETREGAETGRVRAIVVGIAKRRETGELPHEQLRAVKLVEDHDFERESGSVDGQLLFEAEQVVREHVLANKLSAFNGLQPAEHIAGV